MRRLILVPVLTVIALFAIVGGIAYWIYYNYMYYSTDDAQVTAPIVTISAPTSGTLTTLSANLGDHVNAGQTLAQVTPVVAATTGTSATAATSAQPAASTTAASRTSAARALPLTSPISGTVIQVAVVPGQQVTAGSPLLEIYDPSHLTVTAYVDENAINNIQTGQSVDITIDAYKDTKFTGHVKQIVQAAASEFSLLPVQDNASGNFTKVGQRIPVIITLDGSAGKTLMPGMSAEVTIHLH